MDNLGLKKIDVSVSLAKGVLGVLPIVGPMVTEVISLTIPNQRIDRIEDFLRKLEDKVQKIEERRIREVFGLPGFIDVFEESIYQASRALTEERRECIASLVKNTIAEEKIEFIQHKQLLSILGELNDIEILLLKYYALNGKEEDEFWDKHKNVLLPPPADSVTSQEELDKHTIHQTYKQHLSRLGLMRQRFKVPRKDELPEFDEETGMIKGQGYSVTELGWLLLRTVDLEKKI